jgi:hypothetical protein
MGCTGNVQSSVDIGGCACDMNKNVGKGFVKLSHLRPPKYFLRPPNEQLHSILQYSVGETRVRHSERWETPNQDAREALPGGGRVATRKGLE